MSGSPVIVIQDGWTFRDLFKNNIQAHKDAINTLQANMKGIQDDILDMKITDLKALLALANG